MTGSGTPSTLWEQLPTPQLPLGQGECRCQARSPTSDLGLIVLTGGPGAGKTAVLAAARSIYCKHVAVIPEAATILFSGGFPRHRSSAGRRAAQRAIFHVQREAERLVDEERFAHTGLCDRGTVDGEAYWPGEPSEYWHAVGSSRAEQLGRYAGVIHMRTPTPEHAYNHVNPVRIEDARLAREIDERILDAWGEHPRRVVIDSRAAFEDKLHEALAVLERWVHVGR